MSFEANVQEATRVATAQGLRISPRVQAAFASPTSAWELLGQIERDVIEAQQKTQTMRQTGALRTQADFKPYNQLAWSLYKTQTRVWQIILQLRSWWPAGAAAPPPPVDRREYPGFNVGVSRTPPSLSGLGNPLAAVPVWMVVAAAFAVIAAAILIWWVLYQIVKMDNELERLEDFYAHRRSCMQSCLERGESAEACGAACQQAFPTPDEALPHDPADSAFPLVFVASGAAIIIAGIWGASQVLGGGGGTRVTIVDSGGGGGGNRRAVTNARAPSSFPEALKAPAVLAGALGLGWWVIAKSFPPAPTPTSAPRIAVAGLGAYPRGLDRGGRYHNGRKHMPERMSLDAFTRGPGSGYDLEV